MCEPRQRVLTRIYMGEIVTVTDNVPIDSSCGVARSGAMVSSQKAGSELFSSLKIIHGFSME